MDRLKAQRLKRQRRHADHEARRVNNAVGGLSDGTEHVNLFVIRATNARGRKRMRKRQLLASNIATTVAEAFMKVPATWKEKCQIHLEPGTYSAEPGTYGGDGS